MFKLDALGYELPSMPSIPSMATPYVPGYTPGFAPTFLPGSAYNAYEPLSPSTYGDVIQENKAQDEYTSNTEERMEGANRLTSDLGAEEFGPPAPTMTQLVVQSGRNVLTSQIPLTSTTLYIMVGASLGAYLLYQYMYASEA